MKKLSEMTDRELAINEIFSHLDDIIERSERMTSGNFMHNKNANKLSANIIKNRIEFLLSEPHLFISSTQAEPVSEDLELASERYACKFSSSKYGHDKVKDAVVWGANWQKEQMIAKAIDGEVGYWNIRGLFVNMEMPNELEEGDKVKLVIVKED